MDQPRDENLELTRLEREQEQRLKAITKSYMDVPPIGEEPSCSFAFRQCVVESCTFSISGKTNQETIDDDDDDDDEDDQDNDDNDESSGDEEDAEMDMNFGIQGRDA